MRFTDNQFPKWIVFLVRKSGPTLLYDGVHYTDNRKAELAAANAVKEVKDTTRVEVKNFADQTSQILQSLDDHWLLENTTLQNNDESPELFARHLNMLGWSYNQIIAAVNTTPSKQQICDDLQKLKTACRKFTSEVHQRHWQRYVPNSDDSLRNRVPQITRDVSAIEKAASKAIDSMKTESYRGDDYISVEKTAYVTNLHVLARIFELEITLNESHKSSREFDRFVEDTFRIFELGKTAGPYIRNGISVASKIQISSELVSKFKKGEFLSSAALYFAREKAQKNS